MHSLREIFDNHNGRLVGKVNTFFDDNEPYLMKLKHKKIKILEIGVFGGGSLEIWQKYFEGNAEVHGIDIKENTKNNCPAGCQIHIGDQSDSSFLRNIVEKYGPFDLIIDDGSHLMEHQISSFNVLYPDMDKSGVYICEDAFTSYWPEYGGKKNKAGTFIEFAKEKVDELNDWWVDPNSPKTDFCLYTKKIVFVSGAVIFVKGSNPLPTYENRLNEKHWEMEISELQKQAASKNLLD